MKTNNKDLYYSINKEQKKKKIKKYFLIILKIFSGNTKEEFINIS